MGTWGAEIYQNDGALDYVVELAQQVMEKIDYCFQGTRANPDELGESLLMPSVDILRLLCEQCNAPRPQRSTVQAWKDTYLDNWDGQIDQTHPAPGYKEQRRAVIVQTFDKLLNVAE